MVHLVLIIMTLLEVSIAVLICLTIVFIIGNIIQDVNTYHKKWKTKKRNQRLEREYEEFMQRVHKKELKEIDKRKYPLFYWRELIEEKLEDGNL